MNSVRVSSAGRLAIKITIASLITVGLSLYLGVTPANTSIALLTIIYTVGETFGSSLETGLNRAAGSVNVLSLPPNGPPKPPSKR